MFRAEICSVALRELLDVCVEPLNCACLCNLAGVVLELLLDEICVPLEVSVSTKFTVLHFFMVCFNKDLSSWRLVLELFLREDVSHCKALLLRISLGFDLRLVSLILVSVFCSSPGPPANFRLRTKLYVRFDSLDFVFSA